MSGTAPPDSPFDTGCRSVLFLPILFAVCIAGIGATFVFGPDVIRQLQQGAPNAPGHAAPNRPVPPVSDRYFVTGTTTAAVTGAFTLNGQVQIDPVGSYAQDGLVWISFRDGGTTEVLVVFNEPEDSVTVAQGELVAIGQDAACAFDIEVTDSSVSGRVSCPSVEVLDNGERSGSASIDIQFSTATEPMEE